MIAEEGSPEYVIPVKDESRALPLLRSLMGELSASAKAALDVALYDLRARLLGNPRAGDCYEIMRRFASRRIHMDCQIVVCPGLNDGETLQKTMEDLAALYPQVSSVSVVPVGLTRHREGLAALTPVDAAIAGEIIDRVDAFGEKCLADCGSRIFACGDELYRKAGREVPDWDYYEGFPQFENGVGMLRSLEDEFRDALADRPEAPDPVPFAVATGGAAYPLFQKLLQLLADSCYSVKGRLYGIRNDFFGESVNVAGLLTGQDLIAQLKGFSAEVMVLAGRRVPGRHAPFRRIRSPGGPGDPRSQRRRSRASGFPEHQVR